MSWYSSVVRDVAALEPGAAAFLEGTFAAIAREGRVCSSARWRDVVSTVADVLDASSSRRNSSSYRRLQRFVTENRDLLETYPELRTA